MKASHVTDAQSYVVVAAVVVAAVVAAVAAAVVAGVAFAVDGEAAATAVDT